ncbi:MAG: hypothetical protein PVJ57_21660 [Phycisphaerae bacterium]|jgi:hypothetical protein
MNACVFHQRVLLYQASQSLLRQMAEWIEQNPDCALLRMPASVEGQISTLLDRDSPLIADATHTPENVTSLIRTIDPDTARMCVSVYTESVQHDLERLVRSAGATYIDGPLPSEQWTELLLHRRRPERGFNGIENESVLVVWRAHGFVQA